MKEETIEQRIDYLEKKVNWISRASFILHSIEIAMFVVIALIFYLGSNSV